MIEEAIEPTAKILNRIKPVYNMKDRSDMTWRDLTEEKRAEKKKKRKKQRSDSKKELKNALDKYYK